MPQDLEIHDKTVIKSKIYHAAKIGMAVAIHNHLLELSLLDCYELLHMYTEDDGQLCTPLIISAMNGREKVVRALLKFKANLNIEGTVKFDDHIVQGATPLWCAAGSGHLGVVKILVEAGANVNHFTKTNSTPLRAACFDGRLDIVSYLVDHNGNVEIANNYNNTCLMIATYKGHLDVVKFLLHLKIDLNKQANCGSTALHFAAEGGHLDIVKEFVLNGASVLLENKSGLTPLMSAAEQGRSNVVEYFISHVNVSRNEMIDAYELLGASLICIKDYYDLDSYKFLESAMRLRYSDSDNIIYKPERETVIAYSNRVECKTMEDLKAIKDNFGVLCMEALAIRERILGSENPEVPHPVIFRGAVFADNARFDRCLDLWQHAVNLKQKTKVSLAKDFLRFSQVFSQMLDLGLEIDFEYIINIFKSLILELKRGQYNILLKDSKEDLEKIREDLDSNMLTTLYLIMITLKVIEPKAYVQSSKSLRKPDPDKEFKLESTVYQIIKLGIRNRKGQSLLHMAVSPKTPVDDFYTSHVCKVPCALTTKLLIKCGANVNDVDHDRNTSLHLIVPYDKVISDFFTLHTIIMSLIEAGAHIDTVDSRGKTSMEAATSGVAEMLIKNKINLNLRCQAAKVIMKKEIKYKGIVPKELESFIELHGIRKQSINTSLA